MISGNFGENGELLFDIEVISADGERLAIEVLLDTGFTTGWLTMDIQDIIDLGWSLVRRKKTFITVKGEEFFDLYEGTLRVDGKEFKILVVATRDIDENLMGLQWLKTRRLVVDFPLGVLTLQESS